MSNANWRIIVGHCVMFVHTIFCWGTSRVIWTVLMTHAWIYHYIPLALHVLIANKHVWTTLIIAANVSVIIQLAWYARNVFKIAAITSKIVWIVKDKITAWEAMQICVPMNVTPRMLICIIAACAWWTMVCIVQSALIHVCNSLNYADLVYNNIATMMKQNHISASAGRAHGVLTTFGSTRLCIVFTT